mmetsp:Transcript_1476/g.5719  ORF Transcript_1476/g.5719 Transcript_1476/m.5719 type:complete len:272 (+) Transcript_1476:554-1369(+)
MRKIIMSAFNSKRSAMQMRGRACFWYCSAFSISTTPLRVCSATCSMLKSMRSRMVPWSMTRTASSLKIVDSSWIDSAILRISSSRSATSVSTSATAWSCCSLKPPWSSRAASSCPPPERKSKVASLAPSFCRLSRSRYSRCERRKSPPSAWMRVAAERWMFARIVRSESDASASPVVAMRLSVCSHDRNSRVASRVFASISWSSAASDASSNDTMSRFVCSACSSLVAFSILTTSASTESTKSTQIGGSASSRVRRSPPSAAISTSMPAAE